MYTPAEPKRRKFFKIATAGTVASAAGGLPMMFKPNAASQKNCSAVLHLPRS